MSKTVVLLVDHDPGALAALKSELLKRYGADYHIVAHDQTAGQHRLRPVACTVSCV